MTSDRINRISGGVAVAMSMLALAIVLAVMTTGWERHLKDEGIAAHLFQLLIAGQVPFLAAFLATIDRAHLRRVTRFGVLEAGSLALAFGCVAYFGL